MADEKPKKLPPKARVSSPGRVTPKGGDAPASDAGATDAAKGGSGKAPTPRRTEPAESSGTTATGGGSSKADSSKADTSKADTSKVEAKPSDPAKADATTADKPKAGRRPPKTKISRSDSGPGASGRYTPPTQHPDEMPSPMWVPILMFTMFGLGMLVIFLNYVELLPGATTNWYLLVGLGLILGGIITATQYR